ncbi:MAG: serine/threonine protein kinase, partial [Nannocystaceae bacterium]|nr:serine/threonine protein kinase [Nannocystaceae bacterium]
MGGEIQTSRSEMATADTLAGDATASGLVRQPPTPSRPFHAGLELDERYRLLAPLGRGGMGEVWEAQHVGIGRTVAIKVVAAELADPELCERLQREARLVGRLAHPNIVAVTDLGFAAPGRPFVVMERLHGRTLSQLLRERGPLPWMQARDIAMQVAAGLACAHEAGIVHRDLKASNVFVTDDPHGHTTIKIIDFGLAKPERLSPQERGLTRSGEVFGTPASMSPEQVRGEPLDGRADLYALGVMLYQMIVGEPPWQRPSMAALLYCQLFEAAPLLRSRVPGVPAELEALVARCLCKDRALRPASAEALRQELQFVGTGRGATVVPTEALPQPAPELRARYATAVPAAEVAPAISPPSRPRARPWLLPLALGAAIGTAALATALWWGADLRRRDRDAASEPAIAALADAAPPTATAVGRDAAPPEAPASPPAAVAAPAPRDATAAGPTPAVEPAAVVS